MQHPRIELWQIEMFRCREQDAVKGLLFGQKLGNCQFGPFLQRQIEPRDIDSSEVEPIIKSVPVRLILERSFVPPVELSAQHQVEFEMNVGPRLVQPFARVSHDAELIALGNMLPWMDGN